MKLTHLIPICVLTIAALSAQTLKEEESVDDVLDKLHLYAAEANGKAYFALFSKDGVFMGTDASERWTIEEFRDYGMKRFATGQGWTYKSIERNINYSDDTKIAWFDEVLINEKYGEFRGTGVLKQEDGSWKIAQYNLLLPIPNDIFFDVAKQIKAFHNKNNN